ncbi:MAG: HAD family phosphatase [Actinomycetota bacterium]
MAISTVLLDLDGVIRHFNDAHVRAVFRKYGVAPDDLVIAALTGDLLISAQTGRITRAQWIDAVGEAVGSRDAAAEWLADRGVVDPEMVELVGELRARGITVAILTNGTDTIPEELAALGISDLADRVFNTSDIGVAKPDRAIFEHVCRELDVEPSEVFFTDDAPRNTQGGADAGLDAELFVDVATLRSQLAARLPEE